MKQRRDSEISTGLFQNDQELHKLFPLLAGVDEAGRGPIAGPVVVAAVILQADCHINGLNDSKKLTANQRLRIAEAIKDNQIASAIVIISAGDIDKLNILQATLMGMQQAIRGLSCVPDLALVDGNKIPLNTQTQCRAVIKGDGLHACIAAASILAKTTRDAIMTAYDSDYPGYGFAKHKGYPTAAHIEAISKLGLCPIHRMSYAPCQQMTIFDSKAGLKSA